MPDDSRHNPYYVASLLVGGFGGGELVDEVDGRWAMGDGRFVDARLLTVGRKSDGV